MAVQSTRAGSPAGRPPRHRDGRFAPAKLLRSGKGGMVVVGECARPGGGGSARPGAHGETGQNARARGRHESRPARRPAAQGAPSSAVAAAPIHPLPSAPALPCRRRSVHLMSTRARRAPFFPLDRSSNSGAPPPPPPGLACTANAHAFL
jgi:hypothetical protein